MSANERRRTCGMCGGHGTILHASNDIECFACEGSGWVDDDSTDPTNDANEPDEGRCDGCGCYVCACDPKEWVGA